MAVLRPPAVQLDDSGEDLWPHLPSFKLHCMGHLRHYYWGGVGVALIEWLPRYRPVLGSRAQEVGLKKITAL
jgi:hypothetical protein